MEIGRLRGPAHLKYTSNVSGIYHAAQRNFLNPLNFIARANIKSSHVGSQLTLNTANKLKPGHHIKCVPIKLVLINLIVIKPLQIKHNHNHIPNNCTN